jgi:hypothetical protein
MPLADEQPVHDVLWYGADCRSAFDAAGLQVTDVHAPLASIDEPYAWVSETQVAPWVVCMLAAQLHR